MDLVILITGVLVAVFAMSLLFVLAVFAFARYLDGALEGSHSSRVAERRRVVVLALICLTVLIVAMIIAGLGIDRLSAQ